MDRSKPPVLTSPWKIGFFVALMLVTVSIGVAYFVAKSFGVVWPHLLDWGWQGVLQGEGFAFGLTPIMVMVVLSSLAAYFIITAAVRKYRRYLDSGKDYRHLIQTIRQIEDIEDPKQLALLDNYEELRNFLVRVSDEATQRTADLDQREKALENAVTNAERGREEEMGQRVNEQAQFLVTAVTSQPDGSFGDLAEVTLPSLKKLEEAVRNTLRNSGSLAQNLTPPPNYEQDLGELIREVEQNAKAGRDIEQELQRLADQGMPGTPDSGEVRRGLDALITAFEAVDKLSQSLAVLGEEAKGVAINTALQASSGKSSQGDVVQLAEDVKEVAAKFKATSKSYTELTRELRGSLTNVEVSLGDMMAGANSYEGSVIGSVADRMGRWAERALLIADKARTIGGGATADTDMGDFVSHDTPFEQSSYEFSSEEPAAAPAEDDGFETFDQSTTPNTFESTDTDGFETTPDTFETASGEANDVAADESFQTENESVDFESMKQGDAPEPTEIETLDESAAVLDDDPQAAKPAEGIQNEERSIFDEMSTQDEMFAELGVDDNATPTDDTTEPETVGTAHGMPAQSDSGGEFVGEGFSEWDGDNPSADGFDNQNGEATEAAATDESDVYDINTEEPAAPEDNVIDLYALGAEDYDPAVHQG